MLFAPNQQENYRLWSAQRCAVVLGVSMFVFFVGVFICSLVIQVRPSAATTFTCSDEKIELTVEEPDQAQKHNLSSISHARIIRADSSNEIESISLHNLAGQHSYILFSTQQQQDNPIKNIFIIFEPRSLWQFMWERW